MICLCMFKLRHAFHNTNSFICMHKFSKHVDISVLPFLDLGNDANTFFGVDDSSIQFEFPQRFHFNQETFKFGHVSYRHIVHLF